MGEPYIFPGMFLRERQGRGVREARELFHDLIRFETELWSAIDQRLLADDGLPLSWFEPSNRLTGRRSADLLTQLELLDLAGRRGRHCVDHDEFLGQVVLGDAGLGEVVDHLVELE
jgi:hypothetical protein